MKSEQRVRRGVFAFKWHFPFMVQAIGPVISDVNATRRSRGTVVGGQRYRVGGVVAGGPQLVESRPLAKSRQFGSVY